VFALALAACGGGDDDADSAAGCSVSEQKSWLGGYMNDWYFWYDLSPRPNPEPFADVLSYFDALLYTGTSNTFPADRYSGSQSTESFNRFYGDGATLGYGLSVAALELDLDGRQPLYVRYVEPRSPAAGQGVQRGDRLISINNRPVSELITADDFSALTPAQAGDALDLVVTRGNGPERTLRLRAEVFNLTPVTGTDTFVSARGRRIGYVAVKDMISQVEPPLGDAFSRFGSFGVQDVVLDLRYNGGGLVSTSGLVASYISGQRGLGLRYASLLYNDKRQSSNQSFVFGNPTFSMGLPRVFVLMGRRTCSASEQLVNGLRGAGIEVVAVGETSCGKPVGFVPTSRCGRTYSVVNFESVNHRNEGRYFDGFAPTCPVAESFTAPQGRTGDPLLAAAVEAAETGVCPASAQGSARALALRPARERGVRRVDEGDGRPGMIAR
jgi:carboxyl-terminal processing protease